MQVHRRLLASLFLLCTSAGLFAQRGPVKREENIAKWFPKFDFNPLAFQKPAIEFAPFARWWWPGNNVTPDELRREINLFADNNFGGVEIQPINLFIPGTKEARAKAVTWDTPDYYQNVIAVLQEARKRGITVDMTDGSGWPPGGPHLAIEDGFLTLQFADRDINGGSDILIPLPAIKNTSGIPSGLEAVLAVKVSAIKNDLTKTIALEPATTHVLTSFVKNDSVFWKAPEGIWKIIAFWSKPSGEKGMTATPQQGYVVNHFDSSKVLKNYNYLFGARTGLEPYFGNPLRAIFNDSYEFEVDRFYSYDFIAYFQKHRNYDITPWLPAVMQKGYNYASYKRPKSDPDFSFSKEDWRLKYDYDLTLSELLGDRFFKTSKQWMEPKGMLHRTQAYGLNMDMMAQAGLASIPEGESMLGPEANVKIITSGAHLYNRPIVSAESVVFKDRAYTTTPQKIKIAVDKLFAAGINQIIYHGVPYHYTPNELGPEGWYPFSSPLISMVNFSSNLGEGNIFWNAQKEVNAYINKTQYALRSGKPSADVLIYFPFLDVDGMPDNPEEILTTGYLQNVEGPLPLNKDQPNAAKEKWALNVYPLINQLEANGVTWDWVNDVSLREAKLTANKQINVRGNLYQALILANDSIIQLNTARAINALAKKGLNLIATGTLPHRQPSYLMWKVNDQRTARFITDALKSNNSKYIADEQDLNTWIKKLHQAVAFSEPFHFVRQVERDMSDGSRIRFIWNKSDQWQTISLQLDKMYSNSYWLNADESTITKNQRSLVTYKLPPYGSIILYASTQKKVIDLPVPVPSSVMDNSKEIISLNQWNVKVDSVEIKSSPLFDWKTNQLLKFSSSKAVYTSSFQWAKTDSSSPFYLDLGKVYFTAEVFINGKLAGTRIFSPYVLNITKYLQQGSNQLEVRVTTGQLNGFIGKAMNGDKKYAQFKGKADQVMSAGLIGPVVIRPGVD